MEEIELEMIEENKNIFKYWETKDGKFIHVDSLSLRHLENIFNLICRDSWKVEWYSTILKLKVKKQLELNNRKK